MDLRACPHRDLRGAFPVHGVPHCYCLCPEICAPRDELRVPVERCATCHVPDSPHVPPPAVRAPRGRCGALGPVARMIPCACPQIVEFPVYACAIHEECVTESHLLPRVPVDDDASGCPSCDLCPDWRA